MSDVAMMSEGSDILGNRPGQPQGGNGRHKTGATGIRPYDTHKTSCL